VLSGDALTKGIGYMSEARWQEFFEDMVGFGVYPKTLDYRKAFTLDFVKELPTSA
jgi:NitT/TauT family transport system substrate-binding protein